MRGTHIYHVVICHVLEELVFEEPIPYHFVRKLTLNNLEKESNTICRNILINCTSMAIALATNVWRGRFFSARNFM